jgi:hypothetical protein
LGGFSRQRAGAVAPVHEELRDGWLCFESEVERRRFAPVPAGWDALHDEELIALITARPRFAAFRTRAAISL